LDVITCELCGRTLDTELGSEHHLYPKNCKLSKKVSKEKRKSTVTLHPVCHKFIHSIFTNKELVRQYNTISKIKEDERVQKFISWIKAKPEDFDTDFKMSAEKKDKIKYSRGG
jgi:hypothetical protein